MAKHVPLVEQADRRCVKRLGSFGPRYLDGFGKIKNKAARMGCMCISLNAMLLARPEQSYEPDQAFTRDGLSKVARHSAVCVKAPTEIATATADHYVKNVNQLVWVLGQCFYSSRQTAFVARCFVFVDDVFISHAINHAGCFLQDISSN